MRPPGLGSDPCDAVNVAAFVVILLASLRVAAIAFKPSSLLHRSQYLWRSSETIILAVLLTIWAEGVALAPRIALLGREKHRLFALLGTESIIALLAQWSLLCARDSSMASVKWRQVAGFLLVPTMLLLVCPEWPTDGDTVLRHFGTVILGSFCLFVVVHRVPCLLAAVPGREFALETSTERAAIMLGFTLTCFGFESLHSGTHAPRVAFALVMMGCLLLLSAGRG